MRVFSITLYVLSSSIALAISPGTLSPLGTFAQDLRTQYEIPGLAIAIVKDNRVIYTKTLGYRDLEGKKPVTPKTVFGLGSTSKAFTALGAALMVDEGRINWDTPVKKLVSEFELANKEAENQATLIDLLSHQVGQARHDLSWLGSPFSRDEIFSRLQFFDFNLSFRQKWQYSNLLYMAAGKIVEKIYGKSWEDLIHKRVFFSLGMTQSNTSTYVSEKLDDFSYPYKKSGNALVRRSFRRSENMGPAASINSNLEDMARWVLYQLSGKNESGLRLLSKEQFEKMHTAQVNVGDVAWDKFPEFTPTQYALGWHVQKYRGTKLIRHGGSLGGFLSTVAMFPDLNAGIVVLQNYDGFGINSLIMLRALDLLLGLTPIDWHNRLHGSDPLVFEEDFKHHENEGSSFPIEKLSSLDETALMSFVGDYEHLGYGKIKIALEQKTLKFYYNDWDAVLSRSSPTRFLTKGWWDGRVDFVLNLTGSPEELRVPFEESLPDIVFKRRK